jgi:hypothetical protein
VEELRAEIEAYKIERNNLKNQISALQKSNGIQGGLCIGITEKRNSSSAVNINDSFGIDNEVKCPQDTGRFYDSHDNFISGFQTLDTNIRIIEYKSKIAELELEAKKHQVSASLKFRQK